MVVDRRVAWNEFDSTFQGLGRIGKPAELEIGPPDAVGDVTVRRFQGLGFLQHGQRFRDIAVLIDIAVAKIVQYRGLIGRQLKSLFQIDFGGVPVLGAFF